MNIRKFIDGWASLVESREDDYRDDLNMRQKSDFDRTWDNAEKIGEYLRVISQDKLLIIKFLGALGLGRVDPKRMDDISRQFKNNAEKIGHEGLKKDYETLSALFKGLGYYLKNFEAKLPRFDADDPADVYESSDSDLQMMIMLMDMNGYEQDGEGLEFVNLSGDGPEKVSFKDENELRKFIVQNFIHEL